MNVSRVTYVWPFPRIVRLLRITWKEGRWKEEFCEYLTTVDDGCTKLTRREVKNQVSDEGGVQGEGR